VHLNVAGRRQAEALVRQLTKAPLTAIYSSPLERALETAEPLARARNIRIQLCEAVNEVQFGEWSGKSFTELHQLPEWQRFNTARSSTPIPGGELMLEVEARVVSEMECMCRRHADRHVAIVSHADVIKAAVAHFAGIPLDLFHRLEISPASISVVALDEHGPQVLRVNQPGEP
jgi:broad specificity phosphatase PhoE